MKFGVLGGDQRQIELARWLTEKGYQVAKWGLGETTESGLEEALEADCLILPLPVSRDGIHLHTPLSDKQLVLEEFWLRLRRGQLLCGGLVGEEMEREAAKQGAKLVDYFRREELQVRNAVATAEGAILRAMEETDITIHQAKCLVMGFGRIGKLLAHRLRGLGAQVTVSARRPADWAWIEAMGYQSVRTDELETCLGRFQIIFNTIPATLLRRDQLALLRKDSLIVDVASEPGGVDFPAAEAVGVRAVWARSLPGLTAPRTAAAVIGETICEIWKESAT